MMIGDNQAQEVAMSVPETGDENMPAHGSGSYRERVERLEARASTMPQLHIPVEHVLSGGMYARTITIPTGTVLTGAAHKTDHICVAMGDITVLTDEGPKRLTGLHVLATRAGMKRAGFTHADTRWTTICRTDLTDIESIENELVEDPERLQTRREALAGCDTHEKLED